MNKEMFKKDPVWKHIYYVWVGIKVMVPVIVVFLILRWVFINDIEYMIALLVIACLYVIGYLVIRFKDTRDWYL